MEEVKIHPMKGLEDLNEIELTDEFLTDSDILLRKMCNLGYDFDTKKSSRAYDDSNCDTAYYESNNDADDAAEDDDEDEDEDGGDDERAIYCIEKVADFKSQLSKQTNPTISGFSVLSSPKIYFYCIRVNILEGSPPG